MANDFTLEDVVYKTIHKNRKDVSIEDIATATGTGLNHLYRMANKNDTCNLPAAKLIPIMQATDDFSILEFLARKTGHLCIQAPRGIRKGTDPKMDLSEYNKEFGELFNDLVDYVCEPSDELLYEIAEKIDKHIGDSVNIKRRCKKHLMHQTELSL
jgi:hypothetical protein